VAPPIILSTTAENGFRRAQDGITTQFGCEPAVAILSRQGRTQRAENFHIIQHHTLFFCGVGEPLEYQQEVIPCLKAVMHELPHYTRIVRVAEPNFIVIIIVIQFKLALRVLGTPQLGMRECIGLAILVSKALVFLSRIGYVVLLW